MVKVTVAVATYNRAHLLDGLFSNILNQTYDNFEIVIVDDGSTDQTPSILEKYAESDRIRVHRHSKNKGVGAAKDQAVSLAAGDYIAFIDDDDRWLPSKLERQVTLLDSLSDEYAVVQCEMTHFRDGELTHTMPVTQIGDIFPEILSSNEIGFSSTLVRRKSIEEVGGFDPDLHASVDWDLWIRLSRKYLFDGIEEVLVHRYVQEDSITENLSKVLESKQVIRKKYQNLYQNYPAAEIQLSKSIAKLQARRATRAGNRLKTLKYRWQVICLDGFSIKNFGKLGLSIMGPEAYQVVKRLHNRLFL